MKFLKFMSYMSWSFLGRRGWKSAEGGGGGMGLKIYQLVQGGSGDETSGG